MGNLYVIDGTDGSGKQTQYNMLADRLIKEGENVKKITFPNYDSPSSSLVKMYLSGEFGHNAKEVSPYIASTFYAADRYATYKKEFEEFYNEGGILLADRYTTANMVHQAGKINDEKERDKFLEWLWDFEFNLYKLPIPNKVFFLNMPPEYAMKLMENRANKFTGETNKDIHEKDLNHIKDAYNAGLYVSKKYDWMNIECVENEQIRTIEDIHEEIYGIIKKLRR